MSDFTYPRIPQTIYRSDLVKKKQKGAFAIFATIAWIIWLYILTPSIVLMAWWLGLERINMYLFADPQQSVEILLRYFIMIGIGGGLFILWAVYNWLRFRHRNRRGQSVPVENHAIGKAFAILTEVVLSAQAGKIIVYNFDKAGHIIHVKAIANFP
jgi:biofilm PGA synthesis protein PgaD